MNWERFKKINKKERSIYLKYDCYSGIINLGCYNILGDSPMNGAMIDVHGAGEFNVPYDTNKRVVGITHCEISKHM